MGTNAQVVLFLAIVIFCVSESLARPAEKRELLAEFENTHDAMNRNDEMHVPNVYEDDVSDYDNTNERENNLEDADECSGPMGGWLC